MTAAFRSTLLALGLWAMAAATTRAQQMPALPTGVRLVLARCDSIVERRGLIEQLRIELLSTGVVEIDLVDPETGESSRRPSKADRVATLHVYFPECDRDSGMVNLRISDRLTAKYMERSLVVSDVSRAARPRTVALAIVELLRASWLELVLQPPEEKDERASKDVRQRLVSHLKLRAEDDDGRRKSPAQQAREIDEERRAQEEAAHDERWQRKRLEWVASSRLFPKGDSGDLSTTVSLSIAMNRRLRLHVGGIAAGGGAHDESLDVHSFEAAGRVGLGVSGGSDVEIELLPTVEVGFARMSGPSETDFRRVLVIGTVHSTARTAVAKGVDALIGVQAGYVLSGVELKDPDGNKLGGIVGSVIGVTAGLAGIL